MPSDSSSPLNDSFGEPRQKIPLEPSQFLKVIYHKVSQHSNADSILPMIETHFKYLFDHGLSEQADQVLREANFDYMLPYMILKFLEVTLDHHLILQFRSEFLYRAKSELKTKYPKFADKWLEGVK